MRIFDVDLKKAMMDMPNEAILKIANRVQEYLDNIDYENMINNKGYKLIPDMNPLVTSKQLIHVVNKIRKEYGLDDTHLLDDEKAISDIADEQEKEDIKLDEKMKSYFNEEISHRCIPKEDISNLAEKVVCMRRCSKYAKRFKKMTSEEIKNYKLYSNELKEWEENPLGVDYKNGLSWYDKRSVLSYLFVEKKLSEMLRDMPLDTLQKTKTKFEKIRNTPQVKMDSFRKENRAVFKELFGKEDRDDLSSYMNMIDIAEAFENREKELNEPAKVGIFARIKNIFKGKNKQKILTNGTERSNDNSENEWKNSIKYNKSTNTRTTNNMEKHQIQRNNNTPER